MYINRRNQREAHILAALEQHPEETFDEMQLVKLIYKDTPEQLWPAAALNVNVILTKLFKEKKVAKENAGWKYGQTASL